MLLACSSICRCNMVVGPLQELFQGLSFEDLVMWRKPQATGLIVGSIAVVLFVFGWLEYTVLTLTCRVLQVLLVAYGVMLRLGHTVITADDAVKVTSQALDRVHPYMIQGASELAKVITWEDSQRSVKVLVVSIVLAMIGNIFSDFTLVFLGTVGVFALPTLYVQNKEFVDTHLGSFKEHLDGLLGQVPAANAVKKTQ